MTVAQSASGLLLANKPSGPSSYDIIRWLKRSVPGVKIGHCGTLDPLASGLMILLLGRQATKKQSTYMHQDKVYRCVLRLGQQTDTGDAGGRVVRTERIPDLPGETVRAVAERFVGPQTQIPPMYAAIKQGGRPLYKLAREGKVVERAARPITIRRLDIVRAALPEIEFVVHCSSGTYVRTLCEDLASALGTVGTMAALVRESIGDFRVQDAVPAESLKGMSPEQVWSLVKEVAA